MGNVITNRNANRLEFERLLDGAKTYMRHHKVPGGMKRRVLRWYDYSWSRGRIQGGGDINTALGLLPDKLKTELALHVNLSVLKKVTIFQVKYSLLFILFYIIFKLIKSTKYYSKTRLFIGYIWNLCSKINILIQINNQYIYMLLNLNFECKNSQYL